MLPRRITIKDAGLLKIQILIIFLKLSSAPTESGLNLKWRGVWAVYGFVCFSQFYFGFVIKFGELLRKNNNLKGKNRRETPENLLNIADFSNAAA